MDVIIAGAGPTGLMLACELRLAGVDVTLLDRASARSGESRAGGIHPRTMEVLDQRGLVERFLAEGKPIQAGHFAALNLDFSQLSTRYPYTLAILQKAVERLLERRAAELGVRVRWSSEVLGVTQDDTGVTVEVAGAEPMRAAYLVGCDGGRSTVRKLAGIDFPGTDRTVNSLLADVDLTDPPDHPIFQERREHGDFTVLAFEPGWWRVMTNDHEQPVNHDPVDIETVRRSLIRIAGTDFGMHSPRWVSRFGDAARQATEYRDGRLLLAGDAAHIHWPAGGQGMNTGIQDAVNLGWKLAAVVNGTLPPELLDTYQAERHPVAARVLANTRAQTALGRSGPHTDALRAVFGDLIELPDVNSRLAGMISALDLRYEIGDHPLVGRRMPDVDLELPTGPVRMYELLHEGRPILLDLRGDPGLVPITKGAVDVVTARTEADLPAAVLVRPDGHVAWAGDNLTTLRPALHKWVRRESVPA
jgi:3-(3-hydroxy-phenyl)propionate hydroxylase